MNKKILYSIVGLGIIVIVSGFYFYGRPIIAANYATKAINIYLNTRDKDGNNIEQYQLALKYVETANKWRKNDSNLGILKGQLLIALGRYDEAKIHFELVKANDPSAEMAVDELLREIP